MSGGAIAWSSAWLDFSGGEVSWVEGRDTVFCEQSRYLVQRFVEYGESYTQAEDVCYLPSSRARALGIAYLRKPLIRFSMQDLLSISGTQCSFKTFSPPPHT